MRTPLFLTLILLASGLARGADASALLRQAQAAEDRAAPAQALPLYLSALRLRPEDPLLLQKVARQYSDLADGQRSLAEKRRYVETALRYAERAARLDPRSAVDELSLAICHGKLASWGDTREKIAYSRLVEAEARRALALDPDYAWAHHVLGCWNAVLASLGGSQRVFVQLFYGGLPPASYAEAIRHLRRSVDLEPKEPAHRVELGFAYLAAGRRDDAAAEFRRALALPAPAGFDREEKARARSALARLDQGAEPEKS